MKPFRILSPIHKAGRHIELYLEKYCQPLGLTTLEGHLLGYLCGYAPCPIAELHRVFGTKRSTLTSALDRLESRGFSRREINPDDRRSLTVHITETGRELASEMRKAGEAYEAEIISRLSPTDLEGFENVIRAVESLADRPLRER